MPTLGFCSLLVNLHAVYLIFSFYGGTLMVVRIVGLSLVTLFLMGCGGSDDSSAGDNQNGGDGVSFNIDVSGVVVLDSYVSGALVCADLNKNLRCDSSEPSATSNPDGTYSLSWSAKTATPDYQLLARWPKSEPKSDIVMSLSLNSDYIMLGARSEHNGAINPLTTSELEAERLMLMLGYSISQQQQSLAKLRELHGNIFQLATPQVYTDILQAEHYNRLMALYGWIGVYVFNSVTEAPLAQAQVMQQLKAELLAVMQSENLTALQLFTQYGTDIAERVEQELLILGYFDGTATPPEDQGWAFEPTTLNQQDWQSVKESLFNENKAQYSLLLGSTVKSVAQLVYGSGSDAMTVSTLTGPVIVSDENDAEMLVTQCWNNTQSRWVRDDEAITLVMENQTANSVEVDFAGVGVNMRYVLSKISNSNTTWRGLLENSYSHFQLKDLQWPETIYRYKIELMEPVLCRDVNYSYSSIADMPQDSLQELTTADVAKIFFLQQFELEEIVLDEENKRFTLSTPFMEYQWKLVTAPNNTELLKLQPYTGDFQWIAAEYYFLEDGQLFEVKLLTPESFAEMFKNYNGFALPEAFAKGLAVHFFSLAM